MKRIIHWFRAYKWLEKMNRTKPNPYRFSWRYFNPKTVSYTVDLEKLSAFIEGKKLR